ncbi:MAG: DNA-processing protein DprA [Vampirovibrionales bacterium]
MHDTLSPPVGSDHNSAGVHATCWQAEAIGIWVLLSQLSGFGSRTGHQLLRQLQALHLPLQSLWTRDIALLKQCFPTRRAEPLIAAWQRVVATHNSVEVYDDLIHQGLQVLVSPWLGLVLPDQPCERPSHHRLPVYPHLLSTIDDPPMVLYVKGSVAALEGKTLGMVGTRRVSPYGRQVVQHLVEGLAPAGVHIVSGLAEGVDGAAHEAALANHMPTVAVFGCGLDIIFPKHHRRLAEAILHSGGAWISEYPLGQKANRGTFPQRNRIIAGLSYGVVVVEGALASGSLITARSAAEEGRAVFAVPGNVFSPGSEGSHALLRDGAVVTTGAADIINELHWDAVVGSKHQVEGKGSVGDGRAAIQINLTAEQTAVMALLAYEPQPIEHLTSKATLSVAAIQSALTLLELMGLVRQHPGAQYSRC